MGLRWLHFPSSMREQWQSLLLSCIKPNHPPNPLTHSLTHSLNHSLTQFPRTNCGANQSFGLLFLVFHFYFYFLCLFFVFWRRRQQNSSGGGGGGERLGPTQKTKKLFFLSAVFFFPFFFWVQVSLQFFCCQFTCTGFFFVNHSSKEEELFFLLDFSNCRPFSPLRLLPHSLSLSLSLWDHHLLEKVCWLGQSTKIPQHPQITQDSVTILRRQSAMCQAF